MPNLNRRLFLRRTGIALTGVAGLALAGCASSSTSSPAASGSASGSAAAGASGSASAATEYTLVEDLSYAATVGRGHLLDLYIPTSGTGPFPVVIYQSGSAWLSDDTKSRMPGGAGGIPSGGLPSGMPSGFAAGGMPSGMPSVAMPSGMPGGSESGDPDGLGGVTTAASLAKMWGPKGYAIVGLNVRSSSQVKFPGQINDIKAAIRFLRAQAGKYNLDVNRFATMGTSSGAWVATMAGLTPGVAALEGDLGNADQSSSVNCTIDLFGPTDFLQMDAHRIKGGQEHDPTTSPESTLMGFAIQTNKAAVEKADPASYVTKASVPIWISHGLADTIVPHYESELLFAAYQKAGGTASLTLVPKVSHTDSYLASADDSPGRTVKQTIAGETTQGTDPAPTYDTLLTFLDQHLKV